MAGLVETTTVVAEIAAAATEAPPRPSLGRRGTGKGGGSVLGSLGKVLDGDNI